MLIGVPRVQTFRILIISQGQKEPRRYRDNICVTTHGVWCIEWCLDADTAGGRDPHPAAIRRIQNGIDRREVQFGNAGVAETNRKTFTRKPAGSERPIHPHATPQLVQSERLQVDWSRGLQDRRSTSHTFTPQKNGDIDVDN